MRHNRLTRPMPDHEVFGIGSTRLQAVRLAQVATTFVFLYGACNQLTGLRSDIGEGVFSWEHVIPFVEISILPYLSIFVLFAASFFTCRNRDNLQQHCSRLILALLISIACYAVFPLRFDFQRPEPVSAMSVAFRWLWAVDLPFNRAPSLHISVLVILWWHFLQFTRAGSRVLLHAWMTAIAVSVLTTYQHHVIDVVSGLVVGAVCLLMPKPWLLSAGRTFLARWRGQTATPAVRRPLKAREMRCGDPPTDC